MSGAVDGLCLFALVTGTPGRARLHAADGAPVHFVEAGGFTWAVASRAQRPEPTLEALEDWDAVVRRIHARCEATLPFRFGAWISSVDDAARSMRGSARALRAALRQVAGREQMALRLLGPEGVADEVPTRRPPSEYASGAAFLKDRARRAREMREVPELAAVRAAVARLVRGERADRHDGQGRLRATVFHLIDRGGAAAYRRLVRQSAGIPEGFRLAIVGPGPAYAFAPEVSA